MLHPLNKRDVGIRSTKRAVFNFINYNFAKIRSNPYKNTFIMNLQAKVRKKLKPPAGVYFHVPFCGTTCDFCAFYQEKPHRRDLERYLDGMELEIASKLPAGAVETVFWGGGTPGLLPAKDLSRLGQALLNKLGEAPSEWSVEMAPATVKKDKLLALKALGVTRLSMGVQTFNENLLKSLGRLHGPSQVYKAYELMRAVGFDNINLDLIFAIPGQDDEALEADLAEAVRLGPEHISTYCLTFEEDTALYVKLSEGKLSLNPENEARQYALTWKYLEHSGYQQYEISNFARPSYECIHNYNTWEMKDWVGLGPSAASQFKGRRYTNPYSLEEWLKGFELGSMRYVDEVILDESTLALDSLIFGLRTNRGVNICSLKKKFPAFAWGLFEVFFERLLAEGYAQYQENNFSLTLAGRLLADRIGTELINILP